MPYIGRSTDGFGVRNRFIYLASSGDTSVSGADANGATLTFTDGAYVDVYLNGVLLKPTTDYNTSTAGTIAGLSALNTNDEVTVVVYDVFTVADMVSATSGGTFSGAVTFNGAFTSLGIDDNADANAITIDSSERILIGTTAAETLAPSTTPKVQIEGTDHHTSSLSIVRNSNDNGQSLLILGKSRGTSVGADTVVQDDDNVGEILFTAADGSDRTPQVASVRAAVDGTPGSNDMPGRLEFYTTADGSQTISERMRIDSSGKVGIGTNNPGNTLDVIGNISGGYAGFIHNDGNSNSHYGLRVAGGRDDGSTTNYIISLCDGDNEAQGHITLSGSTVSYGAFTAHHEISLPDADKANGYAYGTLLEIDKIYYTQKDGKDSERGIRYLVKKTQSAYSRKILGTYSADMFQQADKDGDYKDNLHQAGVLGDGHVICNGEKGNIIVGDGICSSSTAGVGMKADKMSMIIGIAQEDVTFSSASETKLVPVQYGVKQFIPWTD